MCWLDLEWNCIVLLLSFSSLFKSTDIYIVSDFYYVYSALPSGLKRIWMLQKFENRDISLFTRQFNYSLHNSEHEIAEV